MTFNYMYTLKEPILHQQLSSLVSITVSIPACHAGDLGSIPRRGDMCFARQRYLSRCARDVFLTCLHVPMSCFCLLSCLSQLFWHAPGTNIFQRYSSYSNGFPVVHAAVCLHDELCAQRVINCVIQRELPTSFLVRCLRKSLTSPALLTRPGLPQVDYRSVSQASSRPRRRNNDIICRWLI
jgi:hypothetical protein